MKIRSTVKGGFDNITKYLNKMMNAKYTRQAKQVGEAGVQALREGTPKRTGATAAGWTYEVKTGKNYVELYFKNTAHPNESVNVAKIIEYGHGTGTGGYVRPTPYIKQSLNSVWQLAGDLMDKEVKG